jgi:hypothetical protein
MGKDKGAGLQINYGPLKFIQIPAKDIKQLQDALVYVTKSVPQFKESTDLEEATDFEKTNTLTSDEYDEVKNFQNFNKKDWRWLPKQGIYTRKKKV